MIQKTIELVTPKDHAGSDRDPAPSSKIPFRLTTEYLLARGFRERKPSGRSTILPTGRSANTLR